MKKKEKNKKYELHPKIMYLRRMTKKFLFSLDEGLFIVSGVQKIDEAAPTYADYVPPKNKREELWKQMKQDWLNNRMFSVFKDEGDHCLWYEDFIKANLHREDLKEFRTAMDEK